MRVNNICQRVRVDLSAYMFDIWHVLYVLFSQERKIEYTAKYNIFYSITSILMSLMVYTFMFTIIRVGVNYFEIFKVINYFQILWEFYQLIPITITLIF